jgi:cyclopropane fatty-acyl-phospholipid synthase-like methyltransferase
MRKTHSLGAEYFEALYRTEEDPWEFATSAYEAEKYARTLAVLGAEPIPAALEVGCSIGVLTAQLARRCEHLVATEVSPTALEQARRRCAAHANIDFRLTLSNGEALGGPYDLVLLSEVVYFWDDADLAAFAQRFEHALAPGGQVALVHWLGETDFPKSADHAVAEFRAALLGDYTVELSERTADYRLDLWRRTR